MIELRMILLRMKFLVKEVCIEKTMASIFLTLKLSNFFLQKGHLSS